jgi:hypothetical protein
LPQSLRKKRLIGFADGLVLQVNSKHKRHVQIQTFILDGLYALFGITRFGGFAIRQHRISAFSMRNTCAVTYNILFLPKNQLVMRNRATYHGDCKSPYSAPADCKSAGTGGLTKVMIT